MVILFSVIDCDERVTERLGMIKKTNQAQDHPKDFRINLCCSEKNKELDNENHNNCKGKNRKRLPLTNFLPLLSNTPFNVIKGGRINYFVLYYSYATVNSANPNV